MLFKVTSAGDQAFFSDPELGSITLTFPAGAVEQDTYVEIAPYLFEIEHPYIGSKFGYRISPHIDLNQPVKIEVEFYEGQFLTDTNYPMYVDRSGVKLVQIEDGFITELPAGFAFDLTPDICQGKSMVLTDYAVILFKNLYLPEQEEYSSHLPTWMKWRTDKESKGHRFFRGLIKENREVSTEIDRWLSDFFIEGLKDDIPSWIFKTGMPTDYDSSWVVRGAGNPLTRTTTIKNFITVTGSFIEDFDTRLIYMKSNYNSDVVISET